MKTIKDLAEALEKITGASVQVDDSCGDYLIQVYGCRSSYSVVCDDEDDCYNTLNSMLMGASLYVEMHGRESK